MVGSELSVTLSVIDGVLPAVPSEDDVALSVTPSVVDNNKLPYVVDELLYVTLSVGVTLSVTPSVVDETPSVTVSVVGSSVEVILRGKSLSKRVPPGTARIV